MKAKLKLMVVMLLALTALQCHANNDYTFYIVDELVYKILSEADRTVAVKEPSTFPFGGDKEIPQKVIIRSKTYTVTAVNDKAFENCDGLTSITIPNSVTSIGEDAFYGCSGLTSITIPNSVTFIGLRAFYHCDGLTSVTLGNSVTFHSLSGTFAYCKNLTEINVNPENANYSSINGVVYDKNASTLIFCPNKKASITIPNSVTSIGDRAFYVCSGLTSATIPNSVTSIGDYAFYGCSGLTSITIGNSVTSIGDYAFLDCSELTSVTIPNSVKTIGWWAFENCSKLTSVTIGNSVESIGGSAFDGCPQLEAIYMQCEFPIAFTAKFSDDNLKNTILYIPKGTLAAYEKTTPWRDFWNIVEMDFSGVDEVAEDRGDAVRVENGRIVTEGDALTEVLDLQGRTVYRGYHRVIDNLPRGLYVVRSGNNTVKIKL